MISGVGGIPQDRRDLVTITDEPELDLGLVVRSRQPSRSKSKGDELVEEEVDEVDEEDEFDLRAVKDEDVVEPTTASNETTGKNR